MSVVHNQKMFGNLNRTVLLGLTFVSMCFGQSNWVTSGAEPFSSVAFGNDQFVAVGDSGICTSPNGAIWTLLTGSKRNLNSVSYVNNQFIALGRSGEILTSLDGTTWATNISGTTKQLHAVAYGNNLFVAVGFNDTILLTSPDGTTWTKKSTGKSNLVASASFFNNLFVAVGYWGKILTSPDGVVWTEQISGTTTQLNSVAYGSNKFVVVSDAGILTSPNGIAWTISNPSFSLFDITYGNNQFVAVGFRGSIYTSSDAQTWTKRITGTSTNLSSVVFNGSKFISVGNYPGVVLTSNADGVGILESSRFENDKSNIKINVISKYISAMLPSASRSQFSVRLLDVAGRNIYSVKVDANKRILNIPTACIPTGVYLLEITNGSNIKLSSKINLTR